MSFNNTFDRFSTISGLTRQETIAWEGLIDESRNYIRGLSIKDELTVNDDKRLDNAAAVYAYYRYIIYTSSIESSYKAGDVSITFNNERAKSAEKMWEAELKGLSDLIDTEDSLFFFKRVE